MNFQVRQLALEMPFDRAPSVKSYQTPRIKKHPLRDPDVMPKRARHTDPETSHAGAAAVAVRAGTQKARLLAVYADAPDGLNDEEAAERAGVNMRSCWWKRCNELRKLHFIEPVTDAQGNLVTRLSSVNVPRMVCVITPLGRAALQSAGRA